MTASVSGETCLRCCEHLDAGHVGHAQVEDGGVERGLRRVASSAVRPSGQTVDLVPESRQFGAHELLQRLLVVDEQDAEAVYAAWPFVLRQTNGLPSLAERSSRVGPAAVGRQRQAHGERAAAARAGAACLDLAAVLVDDLMADEQAQARPLAGAAAR